jgi:hypothetical protein
VRLSAVVALRRGRDRAFPIEVALDRGAVASNGVDCKHLPIRAPDRSRIPGD